MDEIICDLLRQVAVLRFVLEQTMTRRLPYSVFDRVDRKTVAKFALREEAEAFLANHVTSFVRKQHEDLLKVA